MSIQPSDIQYHMSGGAANTLPGASLGGAMSNAQFTDTTFAPVSGAEAAAGSVKHRCGYIYNADTALTLVNPVAWILANTPNPFTTIEIGIGTAPLNGVEQTIPNEDTAPVGVTFYPAGSKAAGVALGSIPAQQHRSYWERRTIIAGATVLLGDTCVRRTEGDTL